MTAQTEAIIHLSEKRLAIPNGAQTRMESLLINDLVLPANGIYSLHSVQGLSQIIWPFIGDLKMAGVGGDQMLEEDHLFLINGTKKEWAIQNEYKENPINVIQFCMPLSIISTSSFLIDLSTTIPNQLLNIFDSAYIGKYDYRSESGYLLKNIESKVCIYVLQGSFEVEDRLLHARDGLTLWNLDELEFEALENDSILFIMEVDSSYSN